MTLRVAPLAIITAEFMKKARPRLLEPRVNEVERGDSRNTDFKASGCEFRASELPEPFPEFPPSREGQGGAEGTEEAREGRASGFWPRETWHYKATRRIPLTREMRRRAASYAAITWWLPACAGNDLTTRHF